MDFILKIQNLSVSYAKKNILNNINFSVKQNSINSILGPNGSGKSTLLKAILNAIVFSGDVLIKQQDKIINTKKISAKELAKLIAYVPQRYNIAFEFSVLDVVLMGLYARSGFFGYAKKYQNLASFSLERLGIAHLKDERFSNLSGGQKQLVLIARALIQQSQIIVLDEPVSGLDLGNQHNLLELLEDIKKEGKTIIQTTHYPEHTYNSDNIILLKNGKLFKQGDFEILSPPNLKEIYGIDTQKVNLPNGGYYFCVCKNKTKS
ncbi:ABC transporter ATP-binding protein [Helicobacter sp. 16-1353]|uniref:ABC transporter ATP-binding protein n=1 Tax=Helicobacter sp. 16-1353 TaxID=2004996 RepID=UPI0015EF032B|nr:ABC transporter ATP-binding protein [Helicobacter sp. 16-1353]